MGKRGLSQEKLKLIACITMLLDHIGAVFVRGYTLRIIGRLAFPIYCFLLAEGSVYTKNPKRYAMRLTIGMLLSEIPFDLCLKGHLDWGSQNVMVTLLLGFLALETMKHTENLLLKLAVSAPFVILADLLQTDYGGHGVELVVLFGLVRGLPNANLLRFVGLTLLCWMMNSLRIPIAGVRVPIEMFAVLAMIPICCYSGHKEISSKWIQWMFYLFYPVHLTVLWLLKLFAVF